MFCLGVYLDLLKSGFRYLLLIILLINLGGCTSEAIIDLVSIKSTGALFLAKGAPVNAQVIDELNLEVGEGVTLYSLLDRSTGSYKNIPVKWSLIGSMGALTVITSGKEARFNPTTVGFGYIEVEDSGLTKRITITINSENSPPVAENITPSNAVEDTEKTVTLTYSDKNGDKGTSCSLSTRNNIEETTPCSCDGVGVCNVGVKGITAFNGVANFNYTVTAGGDTSNIANASFTIDDVVTVCPTGFVEADGNNGLGTKDFCVMKYEAKCATPGACDNTNDIPISQAAGIPWGSIRADESAGADSGAQARCIAMSESGFGGTFSLISNPEWMTIARGIENTAINWSSGVVGAGHIPRGHSNGGPFVELAVDDPGDPYSGTGNNSVEAPGAGWEQKRTHTLPNASVIWDFSGNVSEFVDWDLDPTSFTLGPKDESTGSKEFSVPQTGSLLIDDFLPGGAHTSVNSFGMWLGGLGGGATRGGMWIDGPLAGVFMLSLSNDGTGIGSFTGFRCTYRPQQAPIAKTITPANVNENTESIYTLSYGDVNGDLATSCQLSNLTNLTESTPCSCDVGGICTVGVTGINNYSGAASFDYTVSDNDGISNVASASFNIYAVINCPAGFVPVRGNGTLGTTDFCVMKYEAKNDGGGNAVSQTVNPPWVIISADNAQSRCEAMTEGGFSGTFSLISNPEWMTIARDIESVGTNWSGSITGSGNLARGWSAKTAEDGFQNTAVAPVTDGTCIFNSAADTCAAIGTHKLRRTHQLSNGSEIWDLAGNVWEWVDWDTATLGFTVGPADGDAGGWNELNDLVGSLTIDDVAPLGPYTSVQQAGEVGTNYCWGRSCPSWW